MAKPNSAMETLRDPAQKEVEDAAIRLGTMRRAQQQADEQLNMLLNYRDEYRNKLNDNMSTGIASSRWTNYHQFIQTLEKAIEQHRHQLAQCNQKVEQALDVWRNKQQRLHARDAAGALAGERIITGKPSRSETDG